ncbi:MAG: BlaI/MecI/CopY family transcriptional regulator [Trueperaceae bacterium]
MARPKSVGPTKRELEILQILWRRGQRSVREVHEELNKSTSVGYTSVQKIMQIMFEKGLVSRDESSLSHIYEAAQESETTQDEVVTDLLDRVFGGSAMNLVSRALSARPISKQELSDIKELLESVEIRDK